MNLRKAFCRFSSVMFCLSGLLLGGFVPQESHGWGYMQCKKECEPAAQKCKTKAKADECARECPENQFRIVEACRKAASAAGGATSEQESQPIPTPVKPTPIAPETRPAPVKPQVMRPLPSRPDIAAPQTRPQVRPLPSRPDMAAPQTRPQVRPEPVRPDIAVPQTRPQVRPEPVRPDIAVPQTRPQVHPEPERPQVRPEPVRPEVVKPQPTLVTPDVEMEHPSVALKPTPSKGCTSTTEIKIKDQYQQLKAKIDPKGLVAGESLAKKYQTIIPNIISLGSEDAASLQKLASFINPIIAQEKKNCDYIPFYHSGGAFLALLTDIQNFVDKINRQKAYKASTDDFGKGKTPRLTKGSIRTVVDLKSAIDKLGSRVKVDHNDQISPHLVSASLSMLDTDPGESAVGYYFRRHNINLNTARAQSIVKNILNNSGIVGDEKIARYYEILNNYVKSINGVIIQFFVKKGIIKDVVYLSQPFGLFVNTSPAFRNLTEKFIENYQNMSTTDFTTYLRSISSVPGATTLTNLWKDGRLQARILIDSPLLDRDNLKFSIFYELKQNATHSIQELQQELYRQLQQDLQAIAPHKKSAAMTRGVFSAEKEIIRDFDMPALEQGVVY